MIAIVTKATYMKRKDGFLVGWFARIQVTELKSSFFLAKSLALCSNYDFISLSPFYRSVTSSYASGIGISVK